MYPKTKWVGKATFEEQFEHLASEYGEIAEAYIKGDIEHTKEEIIDLIHSANTLLQFLE